MQVHAGPTARSNVHAARLPDAESFHGCLFHGKNNVVVCSSHGLVESLKVFRCLEPNFKRDRSAGTAGDYAVRDATKRGN